MPNSPASIARSIRKNGFSTVALEERRVYLEAETVAAFPLGDGTVPQPVFDRTLVDVTREYFAKNSYRLASVAFASRQHGLLGNAMDRSSVVGSSVDRADSYLSAVLTLSRPASLRITSSKFAIGPTTIELSPASAFICGGDVQIEQLHSQDQMSDVQVATFVLAGEPGAVFRTWWMNTDWLVWRNFLSALPLEMLPIVGFPEPGDRYWTSSSVQGVSARFPGLNLSLYLSSNHLR